MSSRPSSFALTDPGPARIYSTLELLKLPPPEWLIDGIIPKGGLVGLYGPPGAGKSFLAIDMAMAVSAGLPWQGHESKKGLVVYIAAEGGTGISIRALAWLKEHNVSPADVEVGWLTEAIPVYSESEDLEHVIDRVANQIEKNPVLIVIDTLARCFDGDENQQEDMGRFIGGVDRLRKQFGATVLVVHHTRLDGARERGNTAFRGASDTMLAVSRGDKHHELTLTCNKQKDAEEFPEMAFRLKVVGLSTGSEFTTSAVIATEHGDKDTRILKVIADAGPEGIAFKDLRATLAAPNRVNHALNPLEKRLAQENGLTISPATLKRRLVSLVESGKILRKNGIYYMGGLTGK